MEGEGISKEEVYDLILKRELGWKDIILDLINTEQLDPWDVDLSILADRFFEKIEEYQKMDFFISSNVILAASLLLRLKSELILNKYMRGIDEILFGTSDKSEQKSSYERIELDEELPELVLKTPIPRYKRVTLNELIESLNKAIITENRRIKKTIVNQNALRETGIILPQRKEGISDRMKKLQSRLLAHFEANKSHKKIPYDTFIGIEKIERALSFFPLLQLEMNGRVWLDQENVFDEIDIWMKKVYLKYNPNPFKDLELNVERLTNEELDRLEEINEIGDLLDKE